MDNNLNYTFAHDREAINQDHNKYNASVLLDSHFQEIAHLSEEQSKELVFWVLANQINPNIPRHAKMIDKWFKDHEQDSGKPTRQEKLYSILITLLVGILVTIIWNLLSH